MAKKKKKGKKKAPRNPYVLPMKQHKGAGTHKDKRLKRAKEHKGGKKYLDEDDQ